MRAAHWIIGCALCLALMAPAAAAGLDAPGVDHAAQTTTDQLAHDSDIIVGDTLGHSREDKATNSAAAAGTSHNGNDHSGTASSAPAPAPRPHLGWQSLLPGSIQ